MSLKYEPASLPQHISVKWLFLILQVSCADKLVAGLRSVNRRDIVRYSRFDQDQVPLFHPGVEFRANLKSISHRCHLFKVAFVWKLTQETIHLPLGCLQCGFHNLPSPHTRRDVVRYSRFDQDQVPLP